LNASFSYILLPKPQNPVQMVENGTTFSESYKLETLELKGPKVNFHRIEVV